MLTRTRQRTQSTHACELTRSAQRLFHLLQKTNVYKRSRDMDDEVEERRTGQASGVSQQRKQLTLRGIGTQQEEWPLSHMSRKRTSES
jgi:hypothetical protein